MASEGLIKMKENSDERIKKLVREAKKVLELTPRKIETREVGRISLNDRLLSDLVQERVIPDAKKTLALYRIV